MPCFAASGPRGYGIVVTLDDDLQNPPEEIPRLIQKIQEGFDVVYGSPKRTKQGLWRNVPAYLVKLSLQSMMGARTARQVSSFRIFKTRLRESLFSLSKFICFDRCPLDLGDPKIWRRNRSP